VLSLLTRIARAAPILVLVDDAQWLDQESIDALALVGRRLQREGIGLILSRRTEQPIQAFDGLPDGVFVLQQGEPFLVFGRELLRWTPGGYLRGGRRPAGGTAVAITPPSLLSVLRTDWQPVVPLLHPSAMRVSAPNR